MLQSRVLISVKGYTYIEGEVKLQYIMQLDQLARTYIASLKFLLLFQDYVSSLVARPLDSTKDCQQSTEPHRVIRLVQDSSVTITTLNNRTTGVRF